MPNKIIMLSTHGTWGPKKAETLYKSLDKTNEIIGSVFSVENHRENQNLNKIFDTAIKNAIKQMKIATDDTIYIAYDGDSIQNWPDTVYKTKTDNDAMNDTQYKDLPVPPTILLLKFIDTLLSHNIKPAKIKLAQCQNKYISPFSVLSACIASDAKRKSMGIVNTAAKINPILKKKDNINILHTKKAEKDAVNDITDAVNQFKGEKLPLKIYYEIPNKNKKGTEKYGGVDETDKTKVLASTAGWQKYFENKDKTSVTFDKKYFMPVWNKNVMTHPEDFDDKTTITRQITDNLDVLFPNATPINEIKSTVNGGGRLFRTKKKPFHPKTTTVPPEFTQKNAANNAHKKFMSGNKSWQKNNPGNRVHRLSNRGNQPNSNNSPSPFRGVLQASYSGFNSNKQPEPKYVAPTNIVALGYKSTRAKSIRNGSPHVYSQINNQPEYTNPKKILQ